MFRKSIAIWLAPVLFLSGVAHAQTDTSVLLVYTSVFENYKAYSDEKSLDWKEANRQVERRGGWRQYAKEAQEPEPKPETSKPDPNQAMDRVEPKPKR